MFKYSKVAQIAAVFADKQGGTINVLKLIKLMYLADRESMDRTGFPISFDRLVSMEHGPVLSRTLNLINGALDARGAAKWDEWISDRENHDVSVKRTFDRSDLDELSDADLDAIYAVWAQFGGMDKWTLRDYTHKYLGEWKDPEGSMFPIEEKSVFLALGIEEEEAEKLSIDIEAERGLDKVLSTL